MSEISPTLVEKLFDKEVVSLCIFSQHETDRDALKVTPFCYFRYNRESETIDTQVTSQRSRYTFVYPSSVINKLPKTPTYHLGKIARIVSREENPSTIRSSKSIYAVPNKLPDIISLHDYKYFKIVMYYKQWYIIISTFRYKCCDEMIHITDSRNGGLSPAELRTKIARDAKARLTKHSQLRRGMSSDDSEEHVSSDHSEHQQSSEHSNYSTSESNSYEYSSSSETECQHTSSVRTVTPTYQPPHIRQQPKPSPGYARDRPLVLRVGSEISFDFSCEHSINTISTQRIADIPIPKISRKHSVKIQVNSSSTQRNITVQEPIDILIERPSKRSVKTQTKAHSTHVETSIVNSQVNTQTTPNVKPADKHVDTPPQSIYSHAWSAFTSLF